MRRRMMVDFGFDGRYAKYVASASSKVYDRNIRAFRVPSAQGASKAFTEERAEVLDHSEIAAMKDPDNGWLFKRYAYVEEIEEIEEI